MSYKKSYKNVSAHASVWVAFILCRVNGFFWVKNIRHSINKPIQSIQTHCVSIPSFSPAQWAHLCHGIFSIVPGVDIFLTTDYVLATFNNDNRWLQRLPWQMLYLKTSQMTLCSLKGRYVLESLVDDSISSILFLIALTLSISFVHLSIFTLLCGLKSLSSPSSSSLVESLMFCNTVYTFLLAHFQNSSPNKYR